jgi:hypothetical protein
MSSSERGPSRAPVALRVNESLRDVDLEPRTSLLALAGSFIAAALVTGLLFDGWLPGSPPPSWRRPATVALDLTLAAVLYAAVKAYADQLHWTNAHPTEWVAHVMLNAIALSVILHVAIGRRWPFDARRIR